MKFKILFTLSLLISITNVSLAQTGDWVAGNPFVTPASPLPSLGTCAVSGTFDWLSFDTYTNTNHLAVLSYALPPCLDASTGIPSLTLNSVPVLPPNVIFAQIGQGWQATLSPTFTCPLGSQLLFKIDSLQIYDNQSYSGQMASHSISYALTPIGDQLPNNIASVTFSTLGGAAPLPIALLNFDATLVELGETAIVRLDWSTSSEQNSDFFEVQRSADGISWSDIGTRISAAGNSTGKNNYTINDENPLVGISFYRLKQVDKDRNAFLSETRKIVFNKNVAGSVILYPNPATDNLNIKVAITEKAQIEVKVLTIDGRVVQSAIAWAEKGTNILKLDISALACGMYDVNVFANKEIMQSAKLRKD